MICVFELGDRRHGSWCRCNTSRRHRSWRQGLGCPPARQPHWRGVAGTSAPQILVPTLYIVTSVEISPACSLSPSRRPPARCCAADRVRRRRPRPRCRPRPPAVPLPPPIPSPAPVHVRRRRSARPPARGGAAALGPVAGSWGGRGARGGSGAIRRLPRRPAWPGPRRHPSRHPQTTR